MADKGAVISGLEASFVLKKRVMMFSRKGDGDLEKPEFPI
jgi:hypothetical protein